MPELRTLLSGLALGESARWHDGRLWCCDWGAREVLAVDLRGRRETIATLPSFPFCIDWLPDGTLLVVNEQRVLRRAARGKLVPHADLSALSPHRWNEIAVDARGHAYVNCIGFDFPGGEVRPGLVACVAPDGAARRVAGGVAFPNGMAITPDGATLIVAESHAQRLTAFRIRADGGLARGRTWADLAGAAPDGICLDAEAAVWYADVPNRCCVRVREGGEVLDRIEVDRGCFSCALGGDDGRTLFITANRWPDALRPGRRTGRVLTSRVAVPATPPLRPPVPRTRRESTRGQTRGRAAG